MNWSSFEDDRGFATSELTTAGNAGLIVHDELLEAQETQMNLALTNRMKVC